MGRAVKGTVKVEADKGLAAAAMELGGSALCVVDGITR